MVLGPAGEGEEEDHARADGGRPRQEAQDVQLHRVEGPPDRLQEVRRVLTNDH